MTGEQIIANFQTNVGDNSRLSEQQEVFLLQKVYEDVLDTQVWSFATKKFTGTLANGEVDMPEDFRTFQNITDRRGRNILAVVVNGNVVALNNVADSFITGTPLVYVDYARNKLVCTSYNGNVQFLYQYAPTGFTVANYKTLSPIIPERFQTILSYGMARDFFPIDGSIEQMPLSQIMAQNYISDLNKMKRAEFVNAISTGN